MIYSHEVQTMCPVAQGVNHLTSSNPRRSKMGTGKGSKRYFRINTWCGLVCTTAGSL